MQRTRKFYFIFILTALVALLFIGSICLPVQQKANATTSYTVTYNGNQNTGGSAPGFGVYSYGSTVTVAEAGTLVKENYTFSGWNTQANGNGTSYAAGSTFSIYNDCTLYAMWSVTSPTLTAATGYSGHYDGQSHEISVTATQISAEGGSLSYQWYQTEVSALNAISGATLNTYNVTDVKDSGIYYCVIDQEYNGEYGLTTSDAINVSIAASVLTVTASDVIVKKGDDESVLTYTYSGTLYGDDALSGVLTREEGTEAGKYAITQGTLTAGSNYAIEFTGATYTINSVKVTSDSEDSVQAIIEISEGTDPDAELIVEEVEETVLEISSSKTVVKYYAAGLYIGETKQTISGEVTISFAAPASLAEGDSCEIIIEENGVEVAKTVTVENGYITFTTTSLGEFAVVVESAGGLTTGAIIGISIGAFFGLLILAVIILYVLWRVKGIVVFPFLTRIFEKISKDLKPVE